MKALHHIQFKIRNGLQITGTPHSNIQFPNNIARRDNQTEILFV